MRIARFDQLNFPRSLSAFDASFPLHGCFQRVVALDPDQSIDAIFCGEPGTTSTLFSYPAYQV